jgi:hypothetical protein
MAFATRVTTLGVAAAVSLAGFAIGTNRHSVLTIFQAQAQQAPAAASQVSAAGVTLHSVSITLPTSDRMFPGDADAEAINNNCLACHSAGMVLTQPALTSATWKAEVEKMRAQYKAPVAEEDVPAIVAYLTAHKGAK